MPVVDVQCPGCGQPSRIEYCRLGAATICSGCRARTVASVPVGGSYPVTEWELNVRDFLLLVRDRESRDRVAPLLELWFCYRLRGSGDATVIVDSADRPLELLDVHLAIQGDAGRRYALYQTAMSLWR